MGATIWTLDTLSFNAGPDGNGVEWWATVPSGWNSPTSTGRVIDRGTADGSIIAGARLAHRSLLVSKAQVFAPSQAERWAAQNLLEATVEAMVTAAAELVVAEPDGDAAVDVRYLDGLAVRIKTADWFEFDLPLVALAPAKTVGS